MLEQLWQTGPAAQVDANVQSLQSNPLGIYLKQVAGLSTPQLGQLDKSAAGSINAPNIQVPTSPANVDYSGLSSFYSDPTGADYTHDPVLLQMKAADSNTGRNADAAALKAREQLLTQLGSPDVARGILDPSDPVLGAISDDPDKSTSVLARLARSYRDTLAQDEDQLNKGNLFYSSTRAKTLADLDRDYTTSKSDAVGGAQGALESITAQLANAKNGAANADAQAEAAAYNRYLAALAAHPPTLAAPAASGGPAWTPSTLTGYETSADIVPRGTPDANGIWPASDEIPIAINGPTIGGVSANGNQGVFAVDGGMRPADTPMPAAKKAKAPSAEQLLAAAMAASGGVGKRAL